MAYQIQDPRIEIIQKKVNETLRGCELGISDITKIGIDKSKSYAG